MTTPDELARKIIIAAKCGDGLTNVQDYAELLIRRRDEEIRQDEISRFFWLCSNPTSSDDGLPKPESDDDAIKVTSDNQIVAETAAEIAVETCDRDINEGDEMAVWVWKSGDVANAKEYFVRVSWSWNFAASLNYGSPQIIYSKTSKPTK